MPNPVDERYAVLLSASPLPHSYACVRSLARRGVHTVVAAENERLPTFASRLCDEAIIIPSARGDLCAYKDALVGIAARPDVRTVVPIRPQDPYVLAKYREEFDRYVNPVVPTLDSLRNVHDRLRLAEAAEEAGVPMPETRLLDEVDDWGPELIVKSRYNLLVGDYVDSLAPNESRIVKTIKHLEPGEEPDVEAIREEMEHTPIVQEYVRSSDEYVFGALYEHGEARATFQHRQIRGNTYTGSGGVYRESVRIPELEEAGRTLLDALDWHGLACIEYMEDAETGEFKVAEVNPRMWQSLACAVHAGADFPYWYWLQGGGRSDLIEPGYEVGVGSHYLYGEAEHLLSILREDSPLVEKPSFAGTAREIARSCLEMPRFDYLHLDDPFPLVREALNVRR
jgi:predicted ATP-grasp superfamily ATP-dependent carboligase